jgi:hypothetical protein
MIAAKGWSHSCKAHLQPGVALLRFTASVIQSCAWKDGNKARDLWIETKRQTSAHMYLSPVSIFI